MLLGLSFFDYFLLFLWLAYLNNKSNVCKQISSLFDCRTRSIYDFLSGSSWKTLQFTDETKPRGQNTSISVVIVPLSHVNKNSIA